MKKFGIVMAVVGLLLASGSGVQAVDMVWVTVGDPCNVDDIHGDGYGGVDYVYRIGKYEVTNEQYCEFLNYIADVCDPYGLYNSDMNDTIYGGITKSGSAGSYVYSVKAGDANWPVNYVSFYDALRFANWLHNGQPAGVQDVTTTEDGAYTLTGQNSVAVGDHPTHGANGRNVDARVWINSEDEWYKAAYYKGGGTNAGYWDYPTESNSSPTDEIPPGTDMVNGSANYNSAVGGFTNVGAYTTKPSVSAYKTFDQIGNASEWNEAIINISYRGIRSGSFGSSGLITAGDRGYYTPTNEFLDLGFRVASGTVLVSPNGGEELIAGQTETITWSSPAPADANVLLEYSTNNGSDWNDVNTVDNTGSYTWLIPEVTSNQCLIRVTEVNDANFTDTSDDVFTIFQCLGPIPGDLNNDCYVNNKDLAIVAEHWLHTGNPLDPASGIVAYWSFDEGSASTVYDYSGNGNNGTIHGGVTSINGVSGKALDFNGVDGYVDFGDTVGDFGTADFSVVFWLRTNTDRMEIVMGKRVFCGEHSFWELNMSVGPAETGCLLAELYEFTSIQGSFPGNQRLDDNQWHLLTITRQGVEGKLYVDGYLDASRSAAKVIDMSNSAPFRMGYGPCIPVHVNHFYFSGELDEIRIYDRALTATEIQYLYQNP